ncbi:acyltransferase family protein [Sphingomonas sp. AR_OL41]|uniref:acyltransferase family protein n=1 Tax=Sphingomonas sp. AR_OL41 TaxID=3042729 RepID=UPI002481388F|nr:acyltransferase family protein [Sphingomonas sp. AR_OL41]MDH7974956.1 acyltransferase family protein [Sphingomonas sp. AR_OL41]
MSSVRFRRDIQGLRALAVSAVVIGHAFPQILRGGYVGVDIFFVISGFLISGIIVREIEDDRFSVVNFYRRRICRIMPALIVVLFVTMAAGAFLLGPRGYSELAHTAIGTSLFYSNFSFAKGNGYFDDAVNLKPLLNMWSLAVEEQYYIFFPPLFIALAKWLKPQARGCIILVLILFSLLTAEIWRQFSADVAYYMLPTRAFELLIGALLSLGSFAPIRNASMRAFTSCLGLAMMLTGIIFFTAATPIPGVAALLPCVGAALLIHAGSHGHESFGGALLSAKPIVYIGSISYSYYLWHWPVLAFLRNVIQNDLPPVIAGSALVLSALIAIVSYHAVERPFLSTRNRSLPHFKLGAVAILVMVAICGSVIWFRGLPERFSPSARTFFAGSEDTNKRRDSCHYDGGVRLVPYAASCKFGATGVEPDVAVWGDSHGVELTAYLGEKAAREGRSVRELTSSACPPALNFTFPERPRCAKANSQTLQGLIRDKNIRTVVLVANAERYLDKISLAAGLKKSLMALVVAGKQVIFVKQIPVMPFNVPEKAGLLAQYHLSLNHLGTHRPDAERDLEKRVWPNVTNRNRNVRFYDPKTTLCDVDWCFAYKQGVGLLYYNGEHLGLTGVRFAFHNLAASLYQSPPAAGAGGD